MESIRNFIPMESEDQIVDSKVGEGRSKEGQEDVVAKQVVKESSKKAGGRLKRKTSKAIEDKDKRQKKQDDPKKLHLWTMRKLFFILKKADGSYKTYIFFSKILNEFDRENLIMLYRLFNEKYASTRPGFDDLMLWGDMKIMFEPDGDDAVWKIITDTLTRMLQWKLHVNYNVTEMAYELLRRSKQRIEEFNLDELFPPIVTMADQRTMAQLLQEPTEGCEDAIVVPAITADNFELKHGLLTLVTSTLKFPNVPNTSIKLMLFPFSLEGTARIWLEKEPPWSIFSWDDLVSKFINQFFPPSKTTNLRNEITNFQQRFDESFSEAWDRFKDLLRACPHHGFSELHQLDTFYNTLNSKDQDSLNSDASGIFLDKMPRECLAIIESKSKVRYSHNKPVVVKLSMNTSTSAIEESCVTCGGAHSYRNCPAIDGNIFRDNIQEFVSQASAVNYNQGNTSYCPLMMSNQILPPGFPPVLNNPNVQLNQRNNQNRFNQNRGNNFNQGPIYQPPVFQPPAYQAHAYQAPDPQTQGVSKEVFSAYVKANDAVMRNMQTQGQNMQNQLTSLIELLTKFVNSNNASTSSSGTLPSNTNANPRSDPKAITTQSGVSYDGPQIPPPPSFLPKVVENEPDATKDKVDPTNNGSNEDVQPSVVQSESPTLTSEPVNSPIIEPVASLVSALRPNQRPSILYPSRLQDQKLRDKANDQREKFFQIFKDLNFNISFADALILMPKFGPSIKSLLTNKDKLYELARTLLNEHCSAVLLKKLPEKLGDPGKFLIPCDFLGKAECLALADLGASINLMPLSVWNKLSLPDLTPTCMTLELVDHSISRLVGVAEDVYVKVGTFHFSADFVFVDFNADPQEVLGFSDIIASGNPTPYYDLIVSTTSSTLTLFGNTDFLLEEVDAFLALEDDPTSPEVDQSYLDSEGDILLLEAFMNDDPSLPPPNQGNYLPEVRKELKIYEAKSDKSSIDELPETALITVIKSHKRAIIWKLSDIKGIDPEFCTHKIIMEEDIEPAVQHQRRVNPKIYDVIKQEVLKLLDVGLIYPISDSPWVSPIHYVPKKGGFTAVENEDNELISTRLVTANDAVNRNMQNQLTNLTDLMTKFVNANTASTSNLGTLPSNTIANPRSDLKTITTRSGVSYDGP
nr:reverse transcriptase domain-containing protein [Tanacetum cinerariifolium]